MNIIGYRNTATGVFGYKFYVNREIFCSLSSMVVPSPPVFIRGLGLDLVSEFDRDTTLMPGVARKVLNRSTGEEAFRYVYRAPGTFDIILPGGRIIRACASENLHQFRLGPEKNAKITRLTGEIRRCGDMEEEPWFHVIVPDDLGAKELLAILSSPMLRFAL